MAVTDATDDGRVGKVFVLLGFGVQLLLGLRLLLLLLSNHPKNLCNIQM